MMDQIFFYIKSKTENLINKSTNIYGSWSRKILLGKSDNHEISSNNFYITKVVKEKSRESSKNHR
jgi:hypothetical protein